ncbi:hypothetical protein GOODEAATRI_006622 [Goodea atripinnis]|uniref:Uncharacterized protein n=1 Tax=Goodea atripinnis TaxID=208336 RepID=A0ABV0PBW4_9TELE
MEALCRVCVSAWGFWRGGVIRFPQLIFCFSPLVSRNSAGRAAARCGHQRRQQDETQEGACSPNIWQGQGFHDSLKGPSDLLGSKRALGAGATVASLNIFKWGFLKTPQADLRM